MREHRSRADHERLPHAFAPSAKFSCCCAKDAKALEPPYFWYKASVMNRPNACGEASEAELGAERERVALGLRLAGPQLSREVAKAPEGAIG